MITIYLIGLCLVGVFMSVYCTIGYEQDVAALKRVEHDAIFFGVEGLTELDIQRDYIILGVVVTIFWPITVPVAIFRAIFL